MLVIYIAGPYTPQTDNIHDAARIAHHNTQKAIRAGIEILKKGHIPYIPHLTHFIHIEMQDDEVLPKEAWYNYDKYWLEKCNAILYLGKSIGADKELEYAKSHLYQVFYKLDEIPKEIKW